MTDKTQTQNNLAAAQGIVAKHQTMLDLTFFNYPKTISQALHDDETGWVNVFTTEASLIEGGGTTPEKLVENYEKAIPEAIAYHQRVCGTQSHASSGGKRLGCPGKCAITLESYSAGGKGTLSETEAELLAAAYAADNEDGQDMPFTAENLLKYVA